ncbi:MAG: GTP cyclohydrolase II [Sclerophora amabilis]|nr:MAG: GTP cyclohydrolase II [Sclerophora amabilis]
MPQSTSAQSTASSTPRSISSADAYHNQPSPELPPFLSPRPIPISRVVSEFDLNQQHPYPPRNVSPYSLQHTHHADPPFQLPSSDSRSSTPGESSVPPSLLSPAFTPPSTPGRRTPVPHQEAKGVPVNVSEKASTGARGRKPKLLPNLPEVNCVVRSRIPTTTGAEMYLHLYQNNADNKEHLAIVFGSHIHSRSLFASRPGETEMDRIIRGAYTGRLHPGRTSSRAVDPPHLPNAKASTDNQHHLDQPANSSSCPPLVRIHSECYTGETAWSARCDCGEQLDEAARLMSIPSSSPGCGGGVIIYLRQEGRGIGLSEKLKAYNLQDLGSDTVEANLLLRHPADARSYGLATAMLQDLGLGGEPGVRLLTNNPEKVRAVEGPGREVVVKERVAMVPLAWRASKGGGGKGVKGEEVGNYIRTKIEKMGHLLDINGAD